MSGLAAVASALAAQRSHWQREVAAAIALALADRGHTVTTERRTTADLIARVPSTARDRPAR